MADYIIQVLLFQTVFLAVYDLILKKETFFQWNRAYLILTSVLAYILPLLKFESIQQSLSQEYVVLLPEIMLSPATYIKNQIDWSSILFTSLRWIFFIGIFVASILFIYKIIQIFKLISQNNNEKKENYSLILLQKNNTAFSFFKYIFIGKRVQQKDQIIKHELVHVKQKHSLDLLLFEIQKIAFWFNPYSYLYQQRVSEIHEFIADSKSVSKEDKISYFQDLLAEVFQVEKFAFVNAFNKKSIIKKRIIMLTKNSSKENLKFKYLLIIPVLMGMLIYTSCETNSSTGMDDTQNVQKTDYQKIKLRIDVGTVKPDGELVSYKNLTNEEKSVINTLPDKDKFPDAEIYRLKNNELSFYIYKDYKKELGGVNDKNATIVPFGQIDQAPVFPGCEDAEDQGECFVQNITMYIARNFDVDISKNLGLEKGKKRVYVQFKIDKTGNIVDVRARGPHKDLETEAVRVVNSLPQMQPGKENGKQVAVKYTLPITLVVE